MTQRTCGARCAVRGESEVENELRTQVLDPNVKNYWWESFDNWVLLFFRSELGFVIDEKDNDSGSPCNIRPHPVFSLPPDFGRTRAVALRDALKKYVTNPTLNNAEEVVEFASYLDSEAVKNWLSEDDCTLLHLVVAQVARDEKTRWFFFDTFWQVVTLFGWRDIAELVENNPALHRQLAAEDAWYWEDFLLGASLVRPSPFVAQLSASILSLRDNVSPRDAAEYKHRLAWSLDECKLSHCFAAAIAWQRCRKSGIV